jgi:3-phosphoshikimate 1-carboxyvinyltransferase
VDRTQLIANLRLPLDRLPDPLPIPVIERPFNVSITPPGSKSLTNRAIVLAGLAEGTSTLRNALADADDARVMIAAVETLGARVVQRGEDLHVSGVGGAWRVPREGVTLNLGNAGTATRFLAAAAILAPPGAGGITIDGSARMRQRPIGELVALLRELGVRVDELGNPGFPPIRVLPPADLGALKAGLEVGTTASSQFISALMLVAPMLPRGLRLEFTGEVTSRSYVDMTLGLLTALGVSVHAASDDVAEIRPLGPAHGGGRTPLFCFDYQVEPDASGATYFWAAAALVPGATCTVPGLNRDSLQRDAEFADELFDVGADVLFASPDGSPPAPASTTVTGASPIRRAVADLSLMPDAAMTLAAVCCFAGGPSRLTGLRTLRVKETDRIGALQRELGKVGVDVQARAADGNESVCITPPAGGLDCSPGAPPVEFDTYDDHRMAMSLALIGLRRPGVLIRNAGCVAKTYPTFWRDLAKLFE